ncbi:MAG: sugar kinase [Candidatus Lokiarchaeota archaeon]|nr:sugar kinase [Candidatus Lokiarchaeota archaeon]
MTAKVLTFGEIMLRLSPPYFKRFTQTRSFDVIYGGGEANVAVSLANFGIPVDYITRLPNNDLGDACIQYLRQFGVNTGKILRGGDRIGIYFLEIGASARSSKVIYDRDNSAIATADVNMFEWDTIFKDVQWFHWTGITPAISQNLADICLKAVKEAKNRGITVSCDLNYRKKLWKYGKSPLEIMPELVKYCDIAIGNEEDAEKVLGIHAPDTDLTSGKIDPEKYKYVVETMTNQYPNLQFVAVTLRGSISASHNTWTGLLYNGKDLLISPHYEITHIVDRVGGGDSFVAGLIYGLLTFKDNLQQVLNFAVAASCLKHTIFGDFNLVTVDEVRKIMKGDVSGRVSR